MNSQRITQSGFTLIELMVVTTIIGILTAIAIPAYSGMVRRARYAEAKQQMGIMAREVQLYRVENGQYPPDVNPDVKPEGIESWPDPDEIPYESFYDYDNWRVNGGQCYIQIGYAGENRQVGYPYNRLNKVPPGFGEFRDSLVLAIDLYDCDR